MKFVTRGEDNGWQEEIEEELIVEANGVLYEGPLSQFYDQSSGHAWELSAAVPSHCTPDCGVPAKIDMTVSWIACIFLCCNM